MQKLTEEQAKAKRRAEAVELVMQGLRVQLEDLESRNDESVLICSSCRDTVRVLSLFSDIMPRSMVKSLTILLLPISFVIGCGIFCLKFYFWVSYAHSRGN